MLHSVSRLRLLCVATIVMLFLGVSGCSILPYQLEPPTVTLADLKPLPSSGFEQRFEVRLNISNPNAVVLPLKGISYRLKVNGFDLATGVANNLPTINAYQESQVVLTVSAQFISVMRLIADVVSNGSNTVDYALEAKLDLGNPLLPKLNVAEEGSIDLSNLRPPGRSITL